MDAPGTVFYLIPLNELAEQIVHDPSNSQRLSYVDHIQAGEAILRVGLDQKLKNPPYLVTFGRREHNDIVLNKYFSRNDQCYFDFNANTGELILHDISQYKDTDLCDIETYIDEEGVPREREGLQQIWKSPRQCVVVLSPDLYRDPGDPRGRYSNWILRMRKAKFRLVPRRIRDGDEGQLMEERLAFAGRVDPERTYEGTMQRLSNFGLLSVALTTTIPPSTIAPRNLRFQTKLDPTQDKVIRYTRLRQLGKGGQGDVHKVVDMYNGNHYACKIIAVKETVSGLNIHSERDFRAKVEAEVNLVKRIHHHKNIVPYDFQQSFRCGQNIEIFMPIYEGSLHDLIKPLRPSEGRRAPLGSEIVPDALRDITIRMLGQILDALDFVHTQEPPIIHRDIKPANILYRGGGENFFLTDFGIAKVVDTSRTAIGTTLYAAPEVMRGSEQTPKVDIYGLGVTVVDCLLTLPSEDQVRKLKTWNRWYAYIQMLLNQQEKLL
ncbi:kinase-like protein [Nemania sp. FL0916]|nr:kinase-like protein [Nemania sp. FL0916]